jgi:hypothetical protein
MPTKPLERLMFVQGGFCFFCEEPLAKAHASVEHLLASANGGSNDDENCVACCKSVNALFGSMSLKEKFQVVLNQKGKFKCPNGSSVAIVVPKAAKSVASKTSLAQKGKEDKFDLVLVDLIRRGKARPVTVKTLRSTIVALFKKAITEEELSDILARLQAMGKIAIKENKVTHNL